MLIVKILRGTEMTHRLECLTEEEALTWIRQQEAMKVFGEHGSYQILIEDSAKEQPRGFFSRLKEGYTS